MPRLSGHTRALTLSAAALATGVTLIASNQSSDAPGGDGELDFRAAGAEVTRVRAAENAALAVADRAHARKAARLAGEIAATTAHTQSHRTAQEPPEVSAPAVASGSVWDALANCESGGRWSLNSTYDGGLQFHPQTWSAHAPSGYPAYAYQASRQQQIVVGQRVQASQGWNAWPTCARKLGLI